MIPKELKVLKINMEQINGVMIPIETDHGGVCFVVSAIKNVTNGFYLEGTGNLIGDVTNQRYKMTCEIQFRGGTLYVEE